jgi:hypothetical protein
MNAKLSRARIVKVVVLAGLVAGGYVAVRATAAQPHMVNALNALQTAKTELQAATPNKGGHREIAIDRVDQAINQVKLGIAAGG